MRVLDEEDHMIVDIQLHHFVLKPNAVRTSRRYGHPMELKALEMYKESWLLFLQKLNHSLYIKEIVVYTPFLDECILSL